MTRPADKTNDIQLISGIQEENLTLCGLKIFQGKIYYLLHFVPFLNCMVLEYIFCDYSKYITMGN